MTAFDVLVLLAVGGAAALGVVRGFVQESIALLAWVGAIAAVKAGHAPLTDTLTPSIGTASGAAVLAFALLFGLTFLAIRLLARSMGRGARNSVLGVFDRLLGLGFGALKGLIIATVVFLFVTLALGTIGGAGAGEPEWMTQSRSYPLIRASGDALVAFVEERRGA